MSTRKIFKGIQQISMEYWLQIVNDIDIDKDGYLWFVRTPHSEDEGGDRGDIFLGTIHYGQFDLSYVQNAIFEHDSNTLSHQDIRDILNEKASIIFVNNAISNHNTSGTAHNDIRNMLDTKANITTLTTHTSDSTIHVTPADKTNWSGKATDADISAAVSAHNTSGDTHNDIRTTISNKANVTDLNDEISNRKAADIILELALEEQKDAVIEAIENLMDIISEGDTNTLTSANSYTTSTITTHNTSGAAHNDIRTTLGAKADTSTLTAHTGDTTIHVTPADKTNWNGKATTADITSAISTHNTGTTTHNDIRTSVSNKANVTDLTAETTARINADTLLQNTKQELLVSEINIKTINNTSILGSGNIAINSGVTDHKLLSNLDYDNAGHIGFTARPDFDILEMEVGDVRQLLEERLNGVFTGVTDHSLLSNLDYDNAGHIGFASTAALTTAISAHNTDTTAHNDIRTVITTGDNNTLTSANTYTDTRIAVYQQVPLYAISATALSTTKPTGTGTVISATALNTTERLIWTWSYTSTQAAIISQNNTYNLGFPLQNLATNRTYTFRVVYSAGADVIFNKTYPALTPSNTNIDLISTEINQRIADLNKPIGTVYTLALYGMVTSSTGTISMLVNDNDRSAVLRRNEAFGGTTATDTSTFVRGFLESQESYNGFIYNELLGISSLI